MASKRSTLAELRFVDFAASFGIDQINLHRISDEQYVSLWHKFKDLKCATPTKSAKS